MMFSLERAGPDGNNIRAVDLLSSAGGRSECRNDCAAGFDVKQSCRDRATHIHAASPPCLPSRTAAPLAPSNAVTLNGISSNGSEVLFTTAELASYIDTVNTTIADKVDTSMPFWDGFAG